MKKESMSQEPEKSIKKEGLTPARAGKIFKSSLISSFNRHFPDQAFSQDKEVFMQYDVDGLKIKQRTEVVEIPEGKTFSPGTKEKIYTFDPEDANRYFKELDPDVQEAYIAGLQEAIDGGEKLVREYRDDLGAEDMTEEEKKELEKNLQDEEKEIELKKKLIGELTK